MGRDEFWNIFIKWLISLGGYGIINVGWFNKF